MIPQHIAQLPDEIRNQPRFFPVNDDKTPKIKDWNKLENQATADKLTPPVGFVITPTHPYDQPYAVLDFDHVTNDNGDFVNSQIEPLISLVHRSGTYGEWSQSRHGLHYILKPTPNKFPKMNPERLYLDNHSNAPENLRPKLELFYAAGRYIILTGWQINGASNKVLAGNEADAIIQLILQQIRVQKQNQVPDSLTTEKVIYPNNETTDIQRAATMLKYIDPIECSYDEWLHVGMILKNIGAPFELWDEWSQADEARYNTTSGAHCNDKWKTFSEGGSLTIATLHDLAKRGGYSEKTFQREINKSQGSLALTTTSSQHNTRWINMDDYLRHTYKHDLQKFRSVSELKTGLPNLDNLIGGIAPGLYVIGAIPSLGKTTFMHQIADNLAIAGQSVLFFSLEQSQMELAAKTLARECFKLSTASTLTAYDIQKGRYNDVQRQALATAYEHYRLGGVNLNIVTGIHSISISHIEKTVEEFINVTGTDPVVIIDYLQIIGVDKDMSDKMRIDYISSSLKQLQCRFNIALFIISSFNRSNYMQTVDYESFKESGNIEYSADAVWGLQLQILTSPFITALDTGKNGISKSEKRLRIEQAKNQQPRRIELKALKHRNHPLYSVGFLYHSAHDFFEPDPDYHKGYEETSVQTASTAPNPLSPPER